MNSHEWVIGQLDSYSEKDSYKNVVFNVRWERRCENADGISVSIFGELPIEFVPEHFVPFENLTKDIVVGWIENSAISNKIIAMDAGLDELLEAKISPPVVNLSPPWV